MVIFALPKLKIETDTFLKNIISRGGAIGSSSGS